MKIATEDLGYRVNPYDRCVLTLPDPKDAPGETQRTCGFMVLEVDDVAEAGNQVHQARMKKLEEILKFGKVESLMTENGSSYAGRQLRQLADFSFTICMDEYHLHSPGAHQDAKKGTGQRRLKDQNHGARKDPASWPHSIP